MSTAFRNFFIAFILALLGAGTFGHFFANNTLPQMLGDDTKTQSEQSYTYEDFNQSETDISEVTPDTAFTGIIYGCDSNGELLSAVFFRTNETKKTYTVCNLPIDSSIKVNNKNRSLKDIFSTHGHEYLSSRMIYLTGYKIDRYAVIRPAGLAKLADRIAAGNYTPLEYNLTFQFRYEDPEYAQINEVLPPEQRYYKTLSGKTVLKEETVLALFTPNEVVDKTLQDTTMSDIYFQVFRQVFSQTAISKSEMSISKMLECVAETNFQQKDISVCAPLLFAFGDSSYTKHNITYPLLGITGSEPDWENAIQIFRNVEE